MKSTLKMIAVFYIVLCLCELLTVGICFSVLYCTSLSDIFNNQVLSLEMIIFSKILSFLLLHFVFYYKPNDLEVSFTMIESILYFLPIITCLLLILGIIYLLKISNISSQYHEVFLWISIVLMITSFCHFILFHLCRRRCFLLYNIFHVYYYSFNYRCSLLPAGIPQVE